MVCLPFGFKKPDDFFLCGRSQVSYRQFVGLLLPVREPPTAGSCPTN